jgi:transposase
MSQGKAIDVWERQFVVRLKAHFDQERRQNSLVSTQDPEGRVAKALGIGRRSVKEILSTYHKTGQVTVAVPQSKGKPPYRIKPALETVIRQRLRELNRHGLHVSIRSLSHWLSENYEDVPHGTLGRTLQRMGLVYGKSINQPALRKRDEVLIARRAYLRAKRANRDLHGGTIRPEVYLDESYVNGNHSTPRTWYFAEEGPWVQKPSGKGPRLILVHAITVEGWVEGAKLVFQAKRRTGDYHGQMNFENFRRWFLDCLLPPIPASSLIGMDNAPYHNVYVDGACYPSSSTKKSDLQSWLYHHHPEGYQESMIKAELLEACRQLCPKPEYELDRIARTEGHPIIRTPQYHPELQPIEQCWGVVKNHCASKCDYTRKGLRTHLEEGFDKVTPEPCRAAIADMRREEDQYWREDMEEPEE